MIVCIHIYIFIYIFIYIHMYIYIYTCISYVSTYLPSFSVVIPEKPAVCHGCHLCRSLQPLSGKLNEISNSRHWLFRDWTTFGCLGIMKSPIFIGIPWNHYETSNRMEWNMFLLFRCSFACHGILLVPLLVLCHHSEPYPFSLFSFGW